MEHKRLEVPLCVPCREDLKKDGRRIEMVRHRTDTNVKCAVCGRMRYGSYYHVGKAVGSA